MRSTALERGDVDAALEQLTEAASSCLSVERSSVWRFNEDRTQLVCLDLFERSARRHISGQILRSAETPHYFEALDAERTIAAHDARRDPRTREFTKAYLEPNGITSMLDAPVQLGGKLVGVVCHEHVGPPRGWKPWEELVAGTFADFVVMVLGAAERAKQSRALEQYRTRLEQLVDERTRQLRESEKAFKELFGAAPVALVLTALADSRVLAANARAAELFSLTVDQAPGQNAPDYWDDPADRQKLVELVKEQGTVDNFATRLRTKDGRRFWADVAVRALTTDQEPSLLFGIRDVTSQHELEERLRTLATTDELTRALNRRRIFEVADEEIQRAARYQRPLCIAMLDIDHFKRVNDIHGHAVGDEVLRGVADAMRANVRKQDKVGRYGGEELMVVFPETGLEDAGMVTERARKAIEALEIVHEGHRVRVTVSGGVVQWRSQELVGSVVQRADTALYEAKSGGRNRVVLGPLA
jgi:diguanylate cyclase (GGDEF)-like protein/PAS domain S-box-containing protein